MKNKNFMILLYSLALVGFLLGCNTETSAVETAQTTENTSVSAIDTDNLEVGYNENATMIALSGTSGSIDGEGAKISNGIVNIVSPGTYVVSGDLKGGYLHINVPKEDEVHLILDGITIENDDFAAIYVQQADKVTISLTEATQNNLSVTGEFIAIDDNNVDSTIFSKEDLIINGTGELFVSSTFGNGITSKDDLVISSGNYVITTEGHGFEANNNIEIADGTFEISSGKDGFHSENSDDTTLGNILIESGEFNIKSEGDGIQGQYLVDIRNGKFTIVTAGGSGEIEANTTMNDPGETALEATENIDSDTTSTKGIKAEGTLYITGGNFDIDSVDDAVHSNGDINVEGGNFILKSEDDAVHAELNITLNGGTISVQKAFEGFEGNIITINEGEFNLETIDDGINATTTDLSTDTPSITINGGKIVVSSESEDGIDSNGNIEINGGEIYVSSTELDNNSTLDYDGTATINGGIFVGSGSSGMAINFGNASTQGSILLNLNSQESGEITLKNSLDEMLVSYIPPKAYTSVIVSTPSIIDGEVYTLSSGSTNTEIVMNGLIYGGGQGLKGQRGGIPGGNMPRDNGLRPEFNGNTPSLDANMPPLNNENTQLDTNTDATSSPTL